MKVVIYYDVEYFVHPFFKNYGSDRCGNLINIYTLKSPKQKVINGFLMIDIPSRFGINYRIYKHKFVYKCFNQRVDDTKSIKHMNCQ